MSKQTDELLSAVQGIAEIIYMQLPLRYQDAWLKDIMAKNIWLPDDEELRFKDTEIVWTGDE
tara:strand:+ start:390 stop:575 length:186 start_codon:yes stop_codon:yes gene_type:complete